MRKIAGTGFAFFLVGSVLSLPLGAQSVEYKKVYSGDILPGYVPQGQLIETEGYLWVSPKAVFFNVHPVSARAPVVVDVAGLPADMLAKVKAACTSERPNLTSGCQVVVRGRVGKIRLDNYDRAGVFATFVALRP